MRILSYNIHKGFTVGNRALVLQEIRKAIRATKADIVCLQEVVGSNHRHAARMEQWIEAQFEFLADQVWDYKTYGKNAVYDHGHHGNAILSKVPFAHYANHDISILPFSQRGVLHAVTEDGVHVLCAHFGLLSWERRYQASRLRQLLETIPLQAPLVLAGDFNDWNRQVHHELHRLGLREAVQEATGALQKTFPARFPMLHMDRIYYRNLSLVEAGCAEGLHWRGLSDHSPLRAEFHTLDGRSAL
ncbi:MAG: EEP domain-containing protein [Cellvibrionales bacterium]|jgi:endonuclease/exonuclease/phosphatase family metal-dependent hydrolase|nr:endonuclease/exonuclease/phosphatase family protein [Cellvibrionales bacterium]MBK8674929.1 endonuclease/exonuclease/phosphatase family protein [Cellvibrionales bacterium]TXH52267.1 MAG: EEP domain-containing protein [Cellvibrionales bacterium]HRG49433.1 endonuclease/exonuclease/phosphatase family protein [Pseudomonadales bacterium]